MAAQTLQLETGRRARLLGGYVATTAELDFVYREAPVSYRAADGNVAGRFSEVHDFYQGTQTRRLVVLGAWPFRTSSTHAGAVRGRGFVRRYP